MSISDQLSPWAKRVSPSPTLAVDSKAKALKAQGADVCGFGAGEPDFDTPEFIKAAAAKALKDGKTKYAPAAGLPALREALAHKYVNENGITGLSSANVVVSPGGKYSCMLAIQAVCGPGDEVLIPAPYWVSYPEMAKLAGATPKFIFAGMEHGFRVSVSQIREAVTENTKLVVLNSPSNPTGAVYTEAEIREIAEFCAARKIFLMSDEIYEYLLYDDVSHFSAASISPEVAEYVITVGGFSKTFSMTGWRLGTLVAATAIAKAVSSLQSQTTSNATTFAQYGALAALEDSEASKAAVAGMLVHFDRRRNKLLDGLNAIDGIRCARSSGAFYLFPSVQDLGMDSDTFSARILEEKLVAVVSGTGFGADGYMRLSYATSDEVIEKGLVRLKEFCAELN
ncbi:MAG: pyridoxal phosphate-dependent aminotransferase [Verrucomicrobiota bacterium]